METVPLDLGEQSYKIYIGAGLLSDLELVSSQITGEQVFVVSN